jgi:multidrug resistance protein
MESSQIRQLGVLMATVFADMVGVLMVLPLLPFYAERLGANESIIGALVGVFFLAQLLTSPIVGRLSDRYGRRPMIIAGLIASAVSYVLFGLATSIFLLFLSRVIQGAVGTTAVVQAYVADSVEPRDRAKALGWVTAATSAGVMLGPLLGSLSTYLGPQAPFYMAAGLCLVNALCAWRWLPEPQRSKPVPPGMPAMTETGSHSAPRPPLRKAMIEVVRHPLAPISALIWIYAIGMLAFMAMNGVLALYLARAFGVTEKEIGYFYTYVGGISLVMRGLLLGPAVRRFGEIGVTRLGALALVVGLCAIPLADSYALLAVAVLFVPIGTALLFPATTAQVSSRAPRGQIGELMGVQQTFGGIARMVGPLGAGAVFQHVGIRAPFFLAAGVMLAVTFLTGKLRDAPQVKPEAAPEVPVTPA